MSVFQRFHSRLQENIVHRLGWQSLREVQELASSAILDGHNAVVLAPTAGGKTEAAFFPILSDLLEHPLSGTRCIYISPIKALLNNQEERLGVYTQMVGMERFKWHGEAKKSDKNKFCKAPAEILMTTPESLEVMLISGSVPHARIFENLSYVVIDEVHALADCERGSHLMALLERLRAYTPHDFQRIGLSATVGNFEAILGWLQGSSARTGSVINPPKPKSKKQLEIKYLDETDMARETGKRAYGKKSLFFTDSRARAEKVGQALKDREIDIYVHHSSVSREEREIAEEKVAQGQNVAIVCTSTLELGIDVGELDLIFQAEAPSTVASFLQRMGRTGRRPNSVANTTFFTTQKESLLQAIALIELAKEHWVENVRLNHQDWPVFIHQILAMCLQYGAIQRQRIWDALHPSTAFSDISESQFHALVSHLLEHHYLEEESGFLSMGLQAEKTFGKKNFMSMYSVFSSPVAYKVLSQGGQVLGNVEWQFADMIELDYCFVLSGKPWMVKRIEHSQKQVIVDKAPKGKAPKWGGYGPQLLNYELCRKIRDILASFQIFSYCDAAAAEELRALQEDKFFLRNHFAPFQSTGEHVLWWTYAGGRINNTLKYILEHELGIKVISNNYYLKFSEQESGEVGIRKHLQHIQSSDYWTSSEYIQQLGALIPNQRLSKFQDCMPLSLQRNMMVNQFLDLDGTDAFLKQVGHLA